MMHGRNTGCFGVFALLGILEYVKEEGLFSMETPAAWFLRPVPITIVLWCLRLELMVDTSDVGVVIPYALKSQPGRNSLKE